MPNREEIIAEARGWIGVPWLHQGRTRIGIDCAGIVVVVHQAFGLPVYDEFGYQRRPQGAGFLRPFRRGMDQKPINSVMPADVFVFRDGGNSCHAAFVGYRGDQLTIIHSHAGRRKVVEEPLDQGDWLSRRVACFVVRGLN